MKWAFWAIPFNNSKMFVARTNPFSHKVGCLCDQNQVVIRDIRWVSDKDLLCVHDMFGRILFVPMVQNIFNNLSCNQKWSETRIAIRKFCEKRFHSITFFWS